MPAYNKLVRDKIPEIISASGKKANCRILGEDEYIKELDRKLDEECAEYTGGHLCACRSKRIFRCGIGACSSGKIGKARWIQSANFS